MKNTKNIADIYNRYVDDLFTYASYYGFPKETIMDAIHDIYRVQKYNLNLSDMENVDELPFNINVSIVLFLLLFLKEGMRSTKCRYANPTQNTSVFQKP